MASWGASDRGVADRHGHFGDDHVPYVVEDTAWGHRGRAWSTGCIQALIDAVNALA